MNVDKLFQEAEKKAIEEDMEEDRLYISKVFDLQEWGNRHSLYLFAYSIHYKNNEREEATGYFFTEEDHLEYDLFIINFDTNNEGDGAGFVTPRKNEAFKTSFDFAKTNHFTGNLLVPVVPAYSYLLANELILPLEHHQPELKREIKPCEHFDFSQVKRLDIDSEL